MHLFQFQVSTVPWRRAVSGQEGYSTLVCGDHQRQEERCVNTIWQLQRQLTRANNTRTDTGLRGLPGEDSYSQTNRLQTTPRSLLSGRSQGRFRHQDNLTTALKGMELMTTSMKTTALWKVKHTLPAKKETLPSQWHQQHPIKLPTSLPPLYKLQFPWDCQLRDTKLYTRCHLPSTLAGQLNLH